jgi:hypothetical protein
MQHIQDKVGFKRHEVDCHGCGGKGWVEIGDERPGVPVPWISHPGGIDVPCTTTTTNVPDTTTYIPFDTYTDLPNSAYGYPATCFGVVNS